MGGIKRTGTASWTWHSEAGGAWYIALAERAMPPYRRQIHVAAIIDVDESGRVAGVEIIDGRMPEPPLSGECVSPRVDTTPAGATVDTPDTIERVARAIDDACPCDMTVCMGPDAARTMAAAAIAAMPHPPEVVRLIEADNERLRGALEKLDVMISQWANDQGFPRESSACWQVVRAALTPFRSETGS